MFSAQVRPWKAITNRATRERIQNSFAILKVFRAPYLRKAQQSPSLKVRSTGTSAVTHASNLLHLFVFLGRYHP